MRVAATIELNADEEKVLKRLARSNTTSVRLARRACIVLLAAQGLENQAIAAELKIGRVQVGRWRERYAQGGLAAIEQDLPRGGRKSVVDAAEIVRRTTQTLPATATQWSTRTLARETGVSDTTVLRIWRAHGLKPHLVRGFKISRDPKFVEPRNRSRPLPRMGKGLNIGRFLVSTTITQRVSALHARLHLWRTAWLRCSSLQHAGCASSRLARQPARRTLRRVQLRFLG